MTFEGIYVRMVYDDSATGGGRLSEKQFFDNAVAYNNGSGTPTERLLVTYDAFGRIVQQQHIRPTVTDTYTTVYDSQGRVTQETTPTGFINYEYDSFGRKTKTQSGTTVPVVLSEVTYTYDLFGRLSTVNTVRRDGALVDSNGSAPGTPPESTTYFYDLLGRPDYTIMPNGVVEDYTFDNMDRMDLMAHRKSSDNSVRASYDYTYRADGKRTGLNESFSTTTARSNSYTWSYDNAGRLISEVLDSSDNSVDQTESYVYDLVGNRMRKEVNKPATAYVDQLFAYNYDANDRITNETLDNGINGTGIDQTTTYGWTQTQQTSKSVSVPSVSSVVQSMSYGLGGQLERVITTTQNGSGTVTARTQVEYRYDTQGIRFIAIDSTDSNLGTPGIERIENGRTEYLIDRANFTGYQQTIIETVKNAAGQANKRTSYTFGVDEITQTVSNLNASTGAVVSTETLAFGHDGKGSVRALFGAAAAIAQVFTYSAYGELLAIHNGAGTLQPLASSLTSVLYNGEGLDARTGLYNMRARWYSASNARWERLDPFAGNPTDPFSFNKYGFVHGDPVQGVDPTGMFFSAGGMMSAMSIGSALSSLLPGPGDMIRGAFEALVTAYAANLEWDVAWALDWSLADDLNTRGDDTWVIEALLRGAAQPWIDLLTGVDYSDIILAAAGGASEHPVGMAAMRPSGRPRIGLNGPSSGRRLGTTVPFKIGTTRVNAVSLGREKGFVYHAPERGKPIRFEGTHGIPADGRLAARAKAFRERKGLTSFTSMSDRNVAVAKVEVNGKEGFIEKVNQPGGLHSEQLIATRVRDLRAQGNQVDVKEVFTERIPCTTTSCRGDLNDIMPNGSTYFFTRGTGAAAAKDLTTAYRW